MLTNLDTWLACFERRASNPPELPDLRNLSLLSAAERDRIGRSLAIFQLGEQSGGHTLLALARRQAVRCGSPAFVRITECFVREEQRHAATLLEFMHANGIPRLENDWTDGVFRILRRVAGFELAVSVLVTAELIGLQFYRALLNTTGSKRLRAICSLFMQDEALHVAYESELLLALRARRSAPVRFAITLAHGAFHVATACVVWIEHRRVLREAGHTACGFLHTCANHFALYFVPAPRRLARSRVR